MTAGLWGIALLIVAEAASAQKNGADAATAQALFDDGKKLMQAGKLAEACPKLEESQRLDPGSGTQLAIALCHEGQGRTATAWADWNVALSEARKDKRPEREQAAQEHIATLEKKIARARITVGTKLEGLDVRRDGNSVGEAQWSTALPIDPGVHVFEARAPGRKTWSVSVTVKDEPGLVQINVPVLEADTSVPAASPKSSVLRDRDSGDARDEKKDGGGVDRKLLGYIVGGAGVVMAGVGTGFGLSARSKWNAAKTACPSSPCINSEGVTDAKSAGRSADFSTVFFILGGVALAGGVTLVLTAPSDPSTSKKENARSLRFTPVLGTREGGIAIGGEL